MNDINIDENEARNVIIPSISTLNNNLDEITNEISGIYNNLPKDFKYIHDIDNKIVESRQMSNQLNETNIKLKNTLNLLKGMKFNKPIKNDISLIDSSKDGLVEYDRKTYFNSRQITNFAEASDFQNMEFAYTYTLCYLEDEIKNYFVSSNKTIYELYLQYSNYKENGKGDPYYKAYIRLRRMCRYGYGNLKIVDIYNDSTGLDCVVLQDQEGNYKLCYNSTDTSQVGDIIADVQGVFSGILPNGFQSKHAEELLETYCKYAQDTGKKVYVEGYSLGGKNATYAYINLYDEYKSVLGNLSLFNPLLEDYSEEEDNILNNIINDNNLEIYIMQGDIVSAMNIEKNPYLLDNDVTHMIYYNYSNAYYNSCISGNPIDILFACHRLEDYNKGLELNNQTYTSFDGNGNYRESFYLEHIPKRREESFLERFSKRREESIYYVDEIIKPEFIDMDQISECVDKYKSSSLAASTIDAILSPSDWRIDLGKSIIDWTEENIVEPAADWTEENIVEPVADWTEESIVEPAKNIYYFVCELIDNL